MHNKNKTLHKNEGFFFSSPRFLGERMCFTASHVLCSLSPLVANRQTHWVVCAILVSRLLFSDSESVCVLFVNGTVFCVFICFVWPKNTETQKELNRGRE